MATLVVVIVGGADSVVISPPKLVAAPAATQLAVPAHETPRKEPTPDGTGSLLHKKPLVVVSRIAVRPTAVQSVVLKHDTEERVLGPAGVPRSLHCAPPSVVPSVCEPTTMQLVVDIQEIPLSAVALVGIV
jgi:hypothetical protein